MRSWRALQQPQFSTPRDVGTGRTKLSEDPSQSRLVAFFSSQMQDAVQSSRVYRARITTHLVFRGQNLRRKTTKAAQALRMRGAHLGCLRADSHGANDRFFYR